MHGPLAMRSSDANLIRGFPIFRGVSDAVFEEVTAEAAAGGMTDKNLALHLPDGHEGADHLGDTANLLGGAAQVSGATQLMDSKHVVDATHLLEPEHAPGMLEEFDLDGHTEGNRLPMPRGRNGTWEKHTFRGCYTIIDYNRHDQRKPKRTHANHPVPSLGLDSC